MSAASEKVIQLRRLLDERFGRSSLPREETFGTGMPLLDEQGIPRGAISELVVPSAQGSGMLVLSGLLHSLAKRSERVAVVDGKDSLHPCGLHQSDLQRVLWTRCTSAREAMQAVDLLARDGNFPVVILLLGLNPPSELRRLPSSTWHRLNMLAEKSATALMAFTAFPLIGCARLRLSVQSDLSLGKLHVPRSGLVSRLALRVERRRERHADEEVRGAICA
jgi:hypothetical protein